MKKQQANYQDLIKFIAIVAMVIDHLGLYIFPQMLWMRAIGRSAMPVFCFFAGYNFKGALNGKLLSYGCALFSMSYILFAHFITANILISIFLGQIYLYIFKEQLKNPAISYFHAIIISLLFLFTSDYIDYGTLSIAIMIIGYTCRYNPQFLKVGLFAAITLSVFHTTLIFVDINPYLAIFLAIVQYLLLSAKDFTSPVNFNISVISRNTLFIYFAHLYIIQLTFYFINFYPYLS